MSALVVLRHEGFSLEVNDDGLPRVRDVDLADRLGFERPRDIRKLIARWSKEAPEIGVFHVRATVARTSMPRGGEREVESTEYWLIERQALFITTKSDTAASTSVTLALIDAFIAARDELRGISLRNQNVFTRLLNAIVLPAPAEWERMFPGSLVRALCALHNVKWIGGAHPRMLASTNRKIYDMIFSADIAAEIKAGNPNPKFGSNHHQSLTPDARTYLTTQLVVVEALARSSQNKDDFWAKMEAEYAGGFTQLAMGLRS